MAFEQVGLGLEDLELAGVASRLKLLVCWVCMLHATWAKVQP